MRRAWLVIRLLLLAATPASPAANKTRRLPPGLFPRPAPPPGACFNVSADTWVETAKYLFPSAGAIQVPSGDMTPF